MHSASDCADGLSCARFTKTLTQLRAETPEYNQGATGASQMARTAPPRAFGWSQVAKGFLVCLTTSSSVSRVSPSRHPGDSSSSTRPAYLLTPHAAGHVNTCLATSRAYGEACERFEGEQAFGWSQVAKGFLVYLAASSSVSLVSPSRRPRSSMLRST